MGSAKSAVRVSAETRWEHIACPICGQDQFRPLFEKQGEPFVQCAGCSLVLINPRPVYAQVLETYDADYSRSYAAKAVKKRRRVRRWVRHIQRHYAKSGRWLDVGCSTGFVVEAAHNAGFEAHGIDVETWGVQFAREELGLQNLRIGLLEQQDYPAGCFDVISVYEVIEHVPDLNVFVAALSRLLAPNGVVEIRTPDVGHWRVPRRLETWDAIKPSEHLYYFSYATLGRLLANHGLTVVARRFNLKPGIKLIAARP